ncbi:MAG: ABC transporter permease [Alphaproteobacteria bacterium]|nr:ABC transporter permease [Alphaproteobacteria bacterium]
MTSTPLAHPGRHGAEGTDDRLGLVQEAGHLVLRLSGDWTFDSPLCDPTPVAAALAATPGPARVEIRVAALARWDSALVVFVDTVHALCVEHNAPLELGGLPAGAVRLSALAHAVPERAGGRRPGAGRLWVDRIGVHALARLRAGGDQLAFLGEAVIAFGRLFRGRAVFQASDVLLFMRACGPQALAITGIINLLIGMILAFIGAVQLQKFGAGIYVADLVGLAITREMAAVMTGIVLAGRTGAAYAAQLGTMQAQEEIDALTTFGIPPIDFLVLPRMIALSLMMPLLYLYACLVGLLGGMIVGTGMLSLTITQYALETQTAISLTQFAIGLGKSVVFGILVAIAGCLRGMQASRSAAGVGDAATSAVVTGILYIIITDAVFAVMFNILGI